MTLGIDVTVYTMYGVKAPWNDDFVDDYDDVYEKFPLDIIMDGMAGEYIIFGKNLFNSPNFRWGGGGDGLTEIDPSELPNIEAEYKQEFVKWFPQYAELVNKPFKIISFTHYS